VILGDVPKQVLIRPLVPVSLEFGVAGVLADPQLALYRQGSAAAMQVNDNWIASANAAQLSLAMAQVGAFTLPALSRDAAMRVTL